MKILLVSNTYPTSDISGVGTLVFELFSEATRRGFEVRVVTRDAGRGQNSRILSTGGPKMLFPLSALVSYLRLTRSWVPDVVHVHESDGVGLVLWIRLMRELGRASGASRVVATLQVSYAEERRAVRPLSALGRIVSTPTGSERIFKYLRAPLHALLGRLTATLADRVVAPSEVTAAELSRDYGSDGVVVLPNGIRGTPAESEAEKDMPPSVLFVGRLRTRKAVAVLLESMSLLRAEGVETKLVVVGSGEQEDLLRSRCRELLLEDRVEFMGNVERSELAGFYQRASVFCLPSTYEGLPLAILEAMAAGLPVVSTGVSGTPEAVDDGETGLLVAPEDAEALAQALGRLLGDSDLQMRMGQQARARFEQLFAIERVAARHFELFEEMVATLRMNQ